MNQFARSTPRPFTFNEGTELLDSRFPLDGVSHRAVADYMFLCGQLVAIDDQGQSVGLKRQAQLVEFEGPAEQPESFVLAEQDLQVEICLGSRQSGDNNAHCIQNLVVRAVVPAA